MLETKDRFLHSQSVAIITPQTWSSRPTLPRTKLVYFSRTHKRTALLCIDTYTLSLVTFPDIRANISLSYISFSLTDNVSKKIHLLLWIMRSILHKRIRVRRKSGQQSEVRRASAQLGSCRIEIQEIDVVLVDPDFENYLLIDFCQGCRGEEAWRRQEIRRVMAARTAWRD